MRVICRVWNAEGIKDANMYMGAPIPQKMLPERDTRIRKQELQKGLKKIGFRVT